MSTFIGIGVNKKTETSKDNKKIEKLTAQVESLEKENAELTAQVESLEKQVKDLTKKLETKDKNE